jgi:hypothetical protein
MNLILAAALFIGLAALASAHCGCIAFKDCLQRKRVDQEQEWDRAHQACLTMDNLHTGDNARIDRCIRDHRSWVENSWRDEINCMYSKDKQLCDEARKRREVGYANGNRVARQNTENHIRKVDEYLGDYNRCMKGKLGWLDHRDDRLRTDCKRDLSCDLNAGLLNEVSRGCRAQFDERRREEARGYCRCMDRAAHADVENWNC